MRRRTHPIQVLISGLIGIVFFLLVLWLLRFIADRASIAFFSAFVDFLVASAPLIILFSVIFAIGDVFAAFPFPFNLLYPIFSATGCVLLASFLIGLILFLNTYFGMDIAHAIELLKVILYPLIFIVILIAGYLSIAVDGRCGCEEEPEVRREAPRRGQSGDLHGSPTWEEIGEEFRGLCHDICRRVREEINRK
ncbi:MAG: hypothetical protein QHG99_01150 [Methanomicrobiales archaeon]|nr:hypothetical protein [Methanomicrobiales archaeon]